MGNPAQNLFKSQAVDENGWYRGMYNLIFTANVEHTASTSAPQGTATGSSLFFPPNVPTQASSAATPSNAATLVRYPVVPSAVQYPLRRPKGVLVRGGKKRFV